VITGWTGTNCSVQVNECKENPCLNDGRCVDLENDFSCQCTQGFTGKRCQHEVDFCAAEPCRNGGSCTNSLEGFVCQCRPGFLGIQCEIDIDECLDNPCDPVGTDRCLDQVGYSSSTNCFINFCSIYFQFDMIISII